MLPGQRVAGSTLRADDKRHAPLATGHEPIFRGLVHDLVHCQHQEVDEEDLDHGTLARDRRPDADPHEARLA